MGIEISTSGSSAHELFDLDGRAVGGLPGERHEELRAVPRSEGSRSVAKDSDGLAARQASERKIVILSHESFLLLRRHVEVVHVARTVVGDLDLAQFASTVVDVPRREAWQAAGLRRRELPAER